MIYFDTDVLIHLLIQQDAVKQQLATELFQAAVDRQQFFLSHLCILETAFTLRKLGEDSDTIDAMLNAFMPYQPVSSTLSEMTRAIALGKIIGFQNISDCLHVAIAETYCTEIYTFNKSDFSRLQKYTKLKVTILS